MGTPQRRPFCSPNLCNVYISITSSPTLISCSYFTFFLFNVHTLPTKLKSKLLNSSHLTPQDRFTTPDTHHILLRIYFHTILHTTCSKEHTKPCRTTHQVKCLCTLKFYPQTKDHLPRMVTLYFRLVSVCLKRLTNTNTNLFTICTHKGLNHSSTVNNYQLVILVMPFQMLFIYYNINYDITAAVPLGELTSKPLKLSSKQANLAWMEKGILSLFALHCFTQYSNHRMEHKVNILPGGMRQRIYITKWWICLENNVLKADMFQSINKL